MTRFPVERPKRDVNSSNPELSRRLLQAELAERKRISRELHDETGQALMLLRLNLDVLSSRLAKGGTKAKVDESIALLDETIEGLRRIIRRLSPRVLEELGLLAAIRKEVLQLRKQTGIQILLSLPETLVHTAPETEIAIYRCVQEALHNVSKHSQAKTVQVRLEIDPHGLRLQIADDGVGLSHASRSKSKGFGLTGIRGRIAGLGGKVRVSSPAGAGTSLSVFLPIALAHTPQSRSKFGGMGRRSEFTSKEQRNSDSGKAHFNHGD